MTIDVVWLGFTDTIVTSNYSAFNHQGNGLLSADRVARFSATALPFAASEKADVR
jgi:hypothetical protein